jgi:hypothetical protein
MRSIRRNRWAYEYTAELEPFEGGTLVTSRVDAAGSKHYEILNEIAEAVGDDVFADLGIPEAVAKLGKAGRLFGRKEIRHLHHLLHGSERVLALGQGSYDKKQGLVVLTNERLFFFEKSLGSETLEEFPLRSISSMQTSKKLTGERLKIHASGNDAEITHMGDGNANEITRCYRAIGREAVPAPPSSSAPEDPITQIEKLAGLRDRGLLSNEEFEAKKADLLGRL